MKNIDHVLILADGAEEAAEQEPVGHHGTVNTSYVIFDADGTFHADGIVKGRDGSETPLFEDGVSYTITIEAFGYPSVSFPYTKGDAAASEDAGEEGTEEAAEAATEAAAEEVTEAAAEAATEAAAETATEAAAETATEAE